MPRGFLDPYLPEYPDSDGERIADDTLQLDWIALIFNNLSALYREHDVYCQTSLVEPQGMSVVRDFCGHGLGRLFHDEPNIIHIGRPGEGVVLKPGMFFTIEPMINLGKPHVKILSDGWTAVTRDRSLSAQFEHSVGVTATGFEIFTLSQRHAEKPPSPA